METKQTQMGKLSDIIKGNVEIDFLCPECQRVAKPYEMHGQGHRVRIFADGRYVADPSDSYEPNSPYYCCGACGAFVEDVVILRDPFDLVDLIFAQYAESIKDLARERHEFPEETGED